MTDIAQSNNCQRTQSPWHVDEVVQLFIDVVLKVIVQLQDIISLEFRVLLIFIHVRHILREGVQLEGVISTSSVLDKSSAWRDFKGKLSHNLSPVHNATQRVDAADTKITPKSISTYTGAFRPHIHCTARCIVLRASLNTSTLWALNTFETSNPPNSYYYMYMQYFSVVERLKQDQRICCTVDHGLQ